MSYYSTQVEVARELDRATRQCVQDREWICADYIDCACLKFPARRAAHKVP